MFRTIRKFFARSSAQRSFAAASTSRLNLDWITSSTSADSAMQGKLTAMRARARDLERNNQWVRGFLRALENNVIGEAGIGLQMRIRDASNGAFDEIANDRIETAWHRWGKKGCCTVCGRHTWRDVQMLIVRAMARDGEILIRKVHASEGLQVQLIEADQLDETYNTISPDGNTVKFGVEVDKFRRPVAYWLLAKHPGDTGFIVSPSNGKTITRVPASEIIHCYISDRPDQSRGTPWIAASMQSLKMLDGYAEAELVAARTGAAKMGFFTKAAPDGWTGEADEHGNLRMDASPGTIEELPPGVDFKSWSNDHPNAGYGDFVKSNLRGVATSLGISYNSLASDLEGVNYSSIRAGLLEEREVWKSIQRHLIEHVCENIFSEWLTVELLANRLGLPIAKAWKFNAPEFQGRRWAWVDPKKDMEASILGIRSGQTSLRRVISESGGDVYDVFRSIKADSVLAAEIGIVLPELTDLSGIAASTAPGAQ